jgi:hypothetical protein
MAMHVSPKSKPHLDFFFKFEPNLVLKLKPHKKKEKSQFNLALGQIC